MNQYGLKASHVISTGRTYKNYQEKYKNGTRAQLSDYHWCPGSANYTIFAVLYEEYTGRNYQAQPWCAMFASDIVVLSLIRSCKLSSKDAVSAAKELYGGDLPYNCQLFVNQHKDDIRLNHTPKAGSAVIFHTGSKYGHFGIVTGVDSGGRGFTSVEGNTSGGFDKVDPDGGAVVEKYHSLDSRTYFWHFDYTDESGQNSLKTETYKIRTGKSGLKVTADALNIRTYAAGTKTNLTYQSGQCIFPFEKTFIDGKPWYRTEAGWISASYVEGWVQEADGRWWYVLPGYTFTVNNWQRIEGRWYYFDNTRYMVSSQWIQDKDKYYWVNDDGIWEPKALPCSDKYHVVI